MEAVKYCYTTIAAELKHAGKKVIFQAVYKRPLSNVYHCHDFFELLLVMQGNCVQTMDGRSYVHNTGDFIIIRPGEYHTFTAQSNDMSLTAISVETDTFKNFCDAYDSELYDKIADSQPPIIINYAPLSVEFTLQYNELLFSYNDVSCRHMLSLMLKHYLLFETTALYDIPPRIKAVIAEIKKPENLQSGVPRFIELSGYSQSQLKRYIKKYFNMSLQEYISDLKMRSSFNEILYTKEKLENIAYQYGYSTLSHFAHAFKNTFNITPASLRKQYSAWTV